MKYNYYKIFVKDGGVHAERIDFDQFVVLTVTRQTWPTSVSFLHDWITARLSVGIIPQLSANVLEQQLRHVEDDNYESHIVVTTVQSGTELLLCTTIPYDLTHYQG